MKRFLKWLRGDWWTPYAACFGGWGIRHPTKGLRFSDGWTRADAVLRCKILNDA